MYISPPPYEKKGGGDETFVSKTDPCLDRNSGPGGQVHLPTRGSVPGTVPGTSQEFQLLKTP